MNIFKRNYEGKMLRTIIIDDEAHMRQSLETLLKANCPNVKIVSKADSVISGVESIEKLHPDLVLLDIKMDDGTGFDLLDQLPSIDFKVIFITAYDEFAIQAIKFSALDYLLKPVDVDDLVHSIGKAENMILKELKIKLNVLEDNLQTDDGLKKKIILKTFDNIHLVKVRDIIYCESDINYTRFHLIDGQEIIISVTLKEYDDMLSKSGFFRVHKSYLVNLSHIERFEKREGGSVILTNSHKVPVASRKREHLLEIFKALTN
jgi:two-component system LytT family response regulator